MNDAKQESAALLCLGKQRMNSALQQVHAHQVGASVSSLVKPWAEDPSSPINL